MKAQRFCSGWLGLLLTIGAGGARAGIMNGGFETGDFTGWTVGGPVANGQVLQAGDLPGSGLAPVEGNYFALLSTGPGADGIEGVTTLTSIPYIVGADSSISFFLDFLSSQPSAAMPQNDFFQFNVLGNPNFTAQSGDVFSDMTNGSLNLIVPGSYVVAPDGTALTYHTGFGAYFVGLSAYQGQSIEFQFIVSPACGAACANGNFADTALLIDNVSGSNLTAVPEPSMGLSLLLAAVLIVFIRSRRSAGRKKIA